MGAKLGFNFASSNAAARVSTGAGEGSSFARWPISPRELWHGAPLADATLAPARESLGDDAAQAAVGYGRGLDLDAGIRLAEEVAGAGFSSA